MRLKQYNIVFSDIPTTWWDSTWFAGVEELLDNNDNVSVQSDYDNDNDSDSNDDDQSLDRSHDPDSDNEDGRKEIGLGPVQRYASREAEDTPQPESHEEPQVRSLSKIQSGRKHVVIQGKE